MIKILIVLGILVAIGVIIVTILAAIAPKRLVTKEGQFRYDLALALVFIWWFSLLVGLGWLVTWPARALVSRRITTDQ